MKRLHQYKDKGLIKQFGSEMRNDADNSWERGFRNTRPVSILGRILFRFFYGFPVSVFDSKNPFVYNYIIPEDARLADSGFCVDVK